MHFAIYPPSQNGFRNRFQVEQLSQNERQSDRRNLPEGFCKQFEDMPMSLDSSQESISHISKPPTQHLSRKEKTFTIHIGTIVALSLLESLCTLLAKGLPSTFMDIKEWGAIVP